MIISTGMSTPDEIDRTVQAVRAAGTPFALMHCTSTYPTPYEHVQLGCIDGAAGALRGAGRLFGSHARQLPGVRGGGDRRQPVREAFHDVAGAAGTGSVGLDGAAGAEALVQGHSRD